MNFRIFNLMDLKDQLRDQLGKFQEKMEDNPHFNTLREWYQNLPSRYQKIIIYSSLFFILFLISLVPLGHFTSARKHEKKYNQDREIIQNLLKAQIKKTGNLVFPASFDLPGLKNRIQKSLKKFNLLKKQMGEEMTTFKVPKSFQFSSLSAGGLSVSLKTLNLTEVVRIGYSLQNLAPHVKLIGIQTKESANKNLYFDVSYKLASFYMPELKTRKKRGGSQTRKKAERKSRSQ